LSRNRNRVGGPKQKNDGGPPVHQMANESNAEAVPFSFVVPTEFVELPSGGVYYPEGHPLNGESSIEIKQMTAKEEDILTSVTLLKKGVALDRVISSLILDKRIDPDSLLVGDKNAIVIATRVAAYGSEYNTSVSCPSCGASQEYSFDLNEANVYVGDEFGDLDVRNNKDGTFTTVLPQTQVEVTYKLLNGYDEKRMSHAVEKDKKKKTERNVTRQLEGIIVSVNEDERLETIRYLLDNIPSRDSRHLRLCYRLSSPNVDLTQLFECSECGHEQDMEVPLTADFFWPDR